MSKTYWYAWTEESPHRVRRSVRWQGWAVGGLFSYLIGCGGPVYLIRHFAPENVPMAIGSAACAAILGLGAAYLICRARTDPDRSWESYAAARPPFWGPLWRSMKQTFTRADARRRSIDE